LTEFRGSDVVGDTTGLGCTNSLCELPTVDLDIALVVTGCGCIGENAEPIFNFSVLIIALFESALTTGECEFFWFTGVFDDALRSLTGDLELGCLPLLLE
jgi:hypothetical protein